MTWLEIYFTIGCLYGIFALVSMFGKDFDAYSESTYGFTLSTFQKIIFTGWWVVGWPVVTFSLLMGKDK